MNKRIQIVKKNHAPKIKKIAIVLITIDSILNAKSNNIFHNTSDNSIFLQKCILKFFFLKNGFDILVNIFFFYITDKNTYYIY